MPGLISARLLGPPTVMVDGEAAPPELLWRKHLALLLVLWCSPERGRTRDQLIGLLWGEKEERAARHSLSEGLRVIRRAAGDGAVRTEGDRVQWLGDTDLDVHRFAALEHGDPEAASRLVAGHFCDGFSVPDAAEFESWLDEERGRWRTRLVGVLVRAAGICEDRGDANQALMLAERALGLEPHSDRAARAAIRARWLAGDRTGALDLGESFRARLSDNLHVGPDRQTVTLLERIVRDRRPERPEAVPQRPSPRHPPLVGRDLELERLLGAGRQAAVARRASLLVLNSDPGMGRSRLLEECVTRASLEGEAVVRLRAVDHDASQADALWLGLADGGLLDVPGVTSAPPRAVAALAERLPSWAERFPSARDAHPMMPAEAVRTILQVVAEDVPILLAVDDAHRLHPDDITAIPALIRTLGRFPITAIVTMDRTAVSEAVDELRRGAGRDERGVVVRLDPLEVPMIERLVAWALPSWDEASRLRLARRLHADSAGAPAVAVEILSAVVDGLALSDHPGSWPEPARTLDATLPGPLPEALVAAVRLAFRRLPEAAQQILPVMALLQPPVTARQLEALVTVPDLAATLDLVERERWIAADGRGYSFVAGVVRRLLAEEMLTPGQRRRLEDRIARRE